MRGKLKITKSLRYVQIIGTFNSMPLICNAIAGLSINKLVQNVKS